MVRRAKTGPRVIVGDVVSNKMTNTVVVKVSRRVKNPIYGKYVLKSSKFSAHTTEDLPVGTRVRIRETRPISKTKNWVVIERV